jgi:hypothetical protein
MEPNLVVELGPNVLEFQKNVRIKTKRFQSKFKNKTQTPPPLRQSTNQYYSFKIGTKGYFKMKEVLNIGNNPESSIYILE